MFIVNHRGFFFWFTGLILAGAIGAIVAWGLPLGIDFTGGSALHVTYPEARPEISVIESQIEPLALGTVSVRAFGDNGASIRARTLTPEEHTSLLTALSVDMPVQELSFSSVGPSLGGQFTSKALWAILAVMLAVVLYIAFAFRHVSRPVPSWGYGLVVIAMLAIDLIVPMGFFAGLAHYTGAEVDSLFVVALLALLGYVVNDVIVVFDRVREHLAHNEREGKKEEFEITVGKSISETLVRSINTSLTVALALVVLIYFGAPATRNFSIVMLVGILAGTFSSICRSAPLLIPLAKRFAK
jgi:preprotein translocase subunit SecF